MARGKLLRTKIKEAAEKTIPLEIAAYEARWKSLGKKPFGATLRGGLEKFIESLTVGDVIKVTAWLGLTYIIKPVIDKAEELQEQLKIVRVQRIFLGRPVPDWLPDWLLGIVPASRQEISTEARKQLESSDWVTWLIALVIAGLIILFGGEMLQTMGGIVKFAGLLLGI